MGVSGIRIIDLQTILDPKNSALTKQFFEYDEFGDVSSIYYAQANASGGEVCLEQTFTYVTVSGYRNVQKTSWQEAIWSGAEWNI